MDYYFVNKGESPVLTAKCEFDEGSNAASLGLSYKWSKWNNTLYCFETVPGTSATLKIPAVSEDCEYRCEIKDAKGNTEYIHFDIVISPAKAPLFKVAYAIFLLKPKYELTLADKDAVMAANAAYNSLTVSQKKRFDSRYKMLKDVLKDAVTMIEKLQSEDALETAKYNAAVRDAKERAVTKFKVKVKKGKKVLLSWKAVKKASGYQIVYSTKKSFKKSKKVLIKKATTKKVTIKKLKAGKKYYVKMRPITNVKNTKGKMVRVYGSWTSVGKFKAKR